MSVFLSRLALLGCAGCLFCFVNNLDHVTQHAEQKRRQQHQQVNEGGEKLLSSTRCEMEGEERKRLSRGLSVSREACLENSENIDEAEAEELSGEERKEKLELKQLCCIINSDVIPLGNLLL